MRDPARIDPIIKKLRQVWKLNPDWRLGQLISNLQGPGPRDVFYPEDATWEAALDKMLQDEKEFLAAEKITAEREKHLRIDSIQHYADGLLTYKESKDRFIEFGGSAEDFVLKTKHISKQNT